MRNYLEQLRYVEQLLNVKYSSVNIQMRNDMSTSAQIEITVASGKTYKFWVHSDGYPRGVIPRLIDTDELEELRRALGTEDLYDAFPSYFYEIDLKQKTIVIYDSVYSDDNTKKLKGELIFSGTFDEVKSAYGNQS